MLHLHHKPKGEEYVNIELAPLVGLADQVVYITATGTTLRENGLSIVDEVMDSSARFIANPVSVLIDADRVTGLVERLRAAAAQCSKGVMQ